MSGDPVPTLNAQEKTQLLRGYWARFGPFRFVIETGIWHGSGSCMQFAAEAEYVAVEVQNDSAALARSFGFDVRTGDSGELLPGLLASRNAPALFWLDAHNVVEGGDDADSSPLLAELEAILAWPHAAGSVVLIDDVRALGRDGWPDRDELLYLVATKALWDAEDRDDVLRFTPAL